MTISNESVKLVIEAIENGSFTYRDVHHLWPSDIWPDIEVAYEGSLDAARWLHERLLPGWQWGRLVSHGTMLVSREYGQYKSFSELDVKNPARAWLLAILRAYLYEQESK